MTKVTIVSGFLGAGKTTLIKKLVQDNRSSSRKILLLNEFGEYAVDSTFMKEHNLFIEGLSGGCICCAGSGDFGRTVEEIVQWTAPGHIYIEPSGSVMLSAVVNSLLNSGVKENLEMQQVITVVDTKKFNCYLKNFGEFYRNQIEFADVIVLNKAEGLSDEQLEECRSEIQTVNPACTIRNMDADECYQHVS